MLPTPGDFQPDYWNRQKPASRRTLFGIDVEQVDIAEMGGAFSDLIAAFARQDNRTTWIIPDRWGP